MEVTCEGCVSASCLWCLSVDKCVELFYLCDAVASCGSSSDSTGMMGEGGRGGEGGREERRGGV